MTGELVKMITSPRFSRLGMASRGVKRDEARECDEQEAQELGVGQRKRHVCDPEMAFEA